MQPDAPATPAQPATSANDGSLARDPSSLVFAVELDGAGGGRDLDVEEAGALWEAKAPVWLHLNGLSHQVREWVLEKSGLTQPTAGAILAQESRPRYFHGAAGSVIILRGVNLNEGSEPEDMVALRMWSDGVRLVTIRDERLLSARELHSQIVDDGRGPVDGAHLFLALIDRLEGKIAQVVQDYDDQLDQIEERMDQAEDCTGLRNALSNLRTEMVGVRRYLAPQREALNMLAADAPAWLKKKNLLTVRELIDRSQRHWEEVDAARERAMVLKDEISTRLSEQLNKNMYVLSIVAAIFLPLGFLTGLFGINVGGMPGVGNDHAFWMVVIGLAIVTGLQLMIFRMLKWL